LAGEAGPHEMVLPAVNRRGRTITVRVAGSPAERRWRFRHGRHPAHGAGWHCAI
jgi:hypothetical protein